MSNYDDLAEAVKSLLWHNRHTGDSKWNAFTVRQPNGGVGVAMMLDGWYHFPDGGGDYLAEDWQARVDRVVELLWGGEETDASLERQRLNSIDRAAPFDQ